MAGSNDSIQNLSKREYAAIHIAAGMTSAGGLTQATSDRIQMIAKNAVDLADKLFDQLNRT